MIIPNRQLCRWKRPEIVVQQLINHFGEDGLIWLDGDGSDLGRWAILATDPIQQICCRGLPSDPQGSNPFEALRNLEPGHWTGWLSYEAGAWVEPNNSWKKDNMATLWIARHDPILRFDLQKEELWIEGCNLKKVNQLAQLLNSIKPGEEQDKLSREIIEANEKEGIPLDSWQWLTNTDDFTRNVRHIQNLIACGDIFQANLTACCTTLLPSHKCATTIFQRLRKHCPAPFSGVIVASGAASSEAIISASPERFLKVWPSGEVETRPIKGTRPRQLNTQKDADMAADLICSPKDRAENIMIVDLLRNDLGKVCQPGSIYVPQLVGLESYPQVHHLTSVIKGSLQKNHTWVDLIQACWPGGSISGAPKPRACQRLHELEPTSRGPYCGSLLHVDWNGQFDSNILIRSFMLEGLNLRVHAGCGIVADSNPSTETEELNWKLMPLLKAIQ